MHLKDNILNFLYDKEYFINIYDNFIHIFNYQELLSLNSNRIVLKFQKFKIDIKGDKLFIIKMNNKELLIKGQLKNIGKIYE